MPFTHQDFLPKEEELVFPDLNVTSAALRAGAHHLGKYCDDQSKEFMLCRGEEKDPRKCYKEGIEVSKCALEFYQRVKGSCYEEFTKHFQCLDHAGSEIEYHLCKPSQKVFDKCMLTELGQERPEPGYFSKVRVHKTTREKPVRNLQLPEATPDQPAIDSVPPPESIKTGTRFYDVGY